ncbi:uncharacterized protein LOC144139367 [Haemaphysalis longicornis]
MCSEPEPLHDSPTSLSTQVVTKRSISEAALYLAANLLADVVFIMSGSDETSEEYSKARYCIGIAYRCLPLTWAYIASRMFSTSGSGGLIFDMFQRMKEAVDRDAWAWIQGDNRQNMSQQVHQAELDVLLGEAHNVHSIDYEGPSKRLQNDSFLDTMLTALKHHYSVIMKNPPTRRKLHISRLEFTGALPRIIGSHHILVPTLFQVAPYMYIYRVPDYFNFAMVGTLLGVELSKLVGAGTLTVDDLRRTLWSSKTFASYAELQSCLLQRRVQLGFGTPGTNLTDDQQARMLTISHGVRLAYVAMKHGFRWKSSGTHSFDKYWPEAERVFFLRSCLLWCGAKTELLSPREMCMLPLYTMPEFSEHYECKGNDVATASGGFCNN